MNWGVLVCLILFSVTSPSGWTASRELDPIFKHPPSRSLKYSVARNACTSNETWSLAHRYGDTLPEFFEKSLTHPELLNGSLLEISRLTRSPKFSEPWVLGQYWLARLYLQRRLYPLAQRAFADLIRAQATSPKTLSQALGVEAAAMACLVQLGREVPTLPVPQDLPLVRFKPYLRDLTPESIADVQDLALWVLKTDLKSSELFSLFKPHGSHDSLSRGLLAAQKNDIKSAIPNLERYLAFGTYQSTQIGSFRDSVHSLLGRMYFENREYEKSVTHFRAIQKQSNLLLQGVSDLAWAYQLQANHSGAIGAGFNLRATALKSAFAPESSVVTAISFYELCRYPQAFESLERFRNDYQTTYKWLKAWASSDRQGSRLGTISVLTPYQLAIQQLKTQRALPERIGAELLHSPIFLSGQTEINAIIDVRREISQLNQTQNPSWNESVTHYGETLLERETQVLALINRDLKSRLITMLRQLDDIGINAEIIEAETLRRAADDVLWQNLNPGFEKLAKEQKGKVTRQAGHFWSFGETPATYLNKGELWQDEIGNLLATSSDLCGPRRKFKTAGLVK